jgi:hypothetical protein
MIQVKDVSSPGVLFRDGIIFYIKLLMDGVKGVALFQAGLLAFVADMILMLLTGTRRSRFFYSVLAWGERADLWLNLYGPAQRAGENPDGLFGESRAGDATLLGELEELVRKEAREPQPVRAHARAGMPRA